MAKLRLGTSHWLDCAEDAPRVRPALRHNLEADVAIIWSAGGRAVTNIRRRRVRVEGLFAATPDGLPYIGAHRRYPRHLFALGYGGNGMTFGFMAARMLARFVDGNPRPEDRLFSFGRTRP